MPQIWNAINSILNDAGLTHTLTSIAALTEFLYDAHNPTFTLSRIVNTSVITLTLRSVWDAHQNKKDMTAQQYRAGIVRRSEIGDVPYQ